MVVKFEGIKYTVTTKDWWFISKKKLILFLKRCKRRYKLFASAESIFLYLSITLIWIGFAVCTYLLGQKLISSPQNNYNVIDVVWELKNSYFTTVILTFMIDVLTKSKEYKKKVKEQHTIYVDTLHDFESILDPYIEQIHHYHPMYCDKTLSATKRYILANHKPAIDKNQLLISLEFVKKRLDTLEAEYSKGNIIKSPNDLLDHIYDARKQLIVLSKSHTEDEWQMIFELLDCLMDIVDDVRFLWRRDIRIKTLILNRLDKYKSNDIRNDFYYSMLLYGYSFDNKKRRIRLYIN